MVRIMMGHSTAAEAGTRIMPTKQAIPTMPAPIMGRLEFFSLVASRAAREAAMSWQMIAR